MQVRSSVTNNQLGIPCRDARSGGYLSYVMKVDPVRPMVLRCTYWGNDSNPGRLFDVMVNDKIIATQKLDFNDPGHFFDVEYNIPSRLTRALNQVTVKFQAYPGQFAGGFFGCQMLKRCRMPPPPSVFPSRSSTQTSLTGARVLECG